MRLLVVADLHYALPQFDWVTEVADTFDLVIIAGDLLDISSMVDFRAQTVVVQKYIAKLREKTRLIVCSGNHDLDASDGGEKVARWIRNARHFGVPTDGESIAIDDTLFTICPWWDGPLARASIPALLAGAAAERPARWIWVHHAPPSNSPVSWGGSRHFGDTDIEKLILEYQPEAVFSGHVHQSPFIGKGSWVDRLGKTWVFNPGHQFGAPPAHIIYDTDEGAAVWLSAMGMQSVRLYEPPGLPAEKLTAFPEWLKAGDRSKPRSPVPA